MTDNPQWTARRGWLLAVTLAGLFLVQGLAGNLLKSLTWDEPSFIGAGYASLFWGDFEVFPQNPPLPQQLAALQFLFLDRDPATVEVDGTWRNVPNQKIQLGAEVVYNSPRTPAEVAFYARLPNLLFGALLVIAIYAWALRLLGMRAALAAAALAAFAPNLLAHAKVATADIGVTLFMLLAVSALDRACAQPGIGNWLRCGVATGLAAIAKYTALLLAPVFVLIALLELAPGGRCRELRPLLLGGGLVVAVVLAVITLDYAGDRHPSPGVVAYLERLGSLYSDHVSKYRAYLLGEFSPEPRWYYYFVTLALKLPVGVIALVALGLYSLATHPQRARLFRYLVLPAAAVLFAACFDQANVGVRRVLPAIPFLLLIAACAFTSPRLPLALPTLLLALGIASSVSQYPHHLAFFNYAVGGPRNAPELLDDSNVDWGQDMPALAGWQLAHPQSAPLKLRYDGPSVPARWGVSFIVMTDDDVNNPRPGFYALGVHSLVGLRKLGFRDWLTDFVPVAYAGNSIYIYEIRAPDAAATDQLTTGER